VPRRKPEPHELTTEEAMRKMFPLKVREAAKDEAEKARKPKGKLSMPKKDS
jgi:hypothetical protein